MAYFKDLREHIAALDQAGLLVRIDEQTFPSSSARSRRRGRFTASAYSVNRKRSSIVGTKRRAIRFLQRSSTTRRCMKSSTEALL